MGSPREERLAENEAMFRNANERMSQWEEHRINEAEELYFCECSDDDCREKVRMRKADYEKVRSDSCHFFVVHGHETLDVETVIEDHGDWTVIEKNDAVAETVESLNPRSS
jgi:hypothetical protein